MGTQQNGHRQYEVWLSADVKLSVCADYVLPGDYMFFLAGNDDTDSILVAQFMPGNVLGYRDITIDPS